MPMPMPMRDLLKVPKAWPWLHILTATLIVGWMPLAGCADIAVSAKVPEEVRAAFERNAKQDLIVEFDDAAVRAEAAQLNQAKGIMFDDQDTLRFKAERYARIKRDALSALAPGQVEVLKDYAALPMAFLRFNSRAALDSLLSQRLVVRADTERKESLMPGKDSR